jgi:hypothetical protein
MGHNSSLWYLSEFPIVSHKLILLSNLFTCRLKGPNRREARVFSFPHNPGTFVSMGHNSGLPYLGEFPLFPHELILISDLFTCCLKGLNRWEAHVFSFPHNPGISVSMSHNSGLPYLGEFPLFSHELYLFLIHLHDIRRAQKDERPISSQSPTIWDFLFAWMHSRAAHHDIHIYGLWLLYVSYGYHTMSAPARWLSVWVQYSFVLYLVETLWQ